MTICQTDLTLTLNCVIPSKWVQSCPKLVCRPNEKTNIILYFSPNLESVQNECNHTKN